MTRQLNVNGPRVVNPPKRLKHRVEVEVAVAEREVLVDVTPHVLDVYVPQYVTPPLDVLCDVPVAQTMDVPHVYRQSQPRMR